MAEDHGRPPMCLLGNRDEPVALASVLTMIQKLSQQGIRPDAVSKILPPSRLRVIPAQLDDAGAEALRAQGVNEPDQTAPTPTCGPSRMPA
jgi:hypothetical protein